jgi:hypothetical protein
MHTDKRFKIQEVMWTLLDAIDIKHGSSQCNIILWHWIFPNDTGNTMTRWNCECTQVIVLCAHHAERSGLKTSVYFTPFAGWIRHITEDHMYPLVDTLKAMGPFFEALKANILHCTIFLSLDLVHRISYHVPNLQNDVQMNWSAVDWVEAVNRHDVHR